MQMETSCWRILAVSGPDPDPVPKRGYADPASRGAGSGNIVPKAEQESLHAFR
jgi:hypothetical protein